MALDINNITPASIKAKNVATEDYVDTEVSNIDVSVDIADNNDILAQRLGYADYSAMVTAAASGNTIINGGYLNTELIDADTILAKDIGFSGKITGGSGGLGGIIQSANYASSGGTEGMEIDLVNGSIYIA